MVASEPPLSLPTSMTGHLRDVRSSVLLTDEGALASPGEPETENTSVATLVSLKFAVSSTFSKRFRSAVRLSTSLRRYRTTSRSARMGFGCTELLATSRYRTSSAIHSLC
jgi:hypothetical protein